MSWQLVKTVLSFSSPMGERKLCTTFILLFSPGFTSFLVHPNALSVGNVGIIKDLNVWLHILLILGKDKGHPMTWLGRQRGEVEV